MATNEELVFAIQQAKTAGDSGKLAQLCEELYEQNKGLVYDTSLGYKNLYANNEEDREDMDSVAKEALFSAAYSYNPTKGASFATWAKYHEIEFALRDYIGNDRLVHIPKKLQALIKLYDKIVDVYKESHQGSFPLDKIILVELNKVVKVTPARLNDIKVGKAAQEFVCMHAQIKEDGNTYEDVIDRVDFTYEVKTSEEKVIQEDENRRVAEMILLLPQLEQDVIRMVYYEELKQTEIAVILGKTRQEINKILNRAYKHLKAMQGICDIGKDRGWLSEKY